MLLILRQNDIITFSVNDPCLIADDSFLSVNGPCLIVDDPCLAVNNRLVVVGPCLAIGILSVK